MDVSFSAANVTHDLMEVCVQSFDNDNYHRFNDEPSSELERDVMKIRRKYKDVSDYNRAVLLYNEYMSLLALKYGSAEILNIKIKAGQVTERIPPTPGLKMNEMNKFLVKNKMVLSKRRTNDINTSVLKVGVRELNEDRENVNTRMSGLEDAPELKKHIMKMIEQGTYKGANRGISVPVNSSTDFLEEYFRNRNRAIETKKHQEEEPVITLAEYVSGEYLDKIKHTEEEERETVFFRGEYIDQESANELQIYRELANYGWDSMKVMRGSGVNKKVANKFSEETKKQAKKRRKAEKKKEKADSTMVQLFTDGNFENFKQFQQEMESFTASEIFTKY